MPPHERKKKMKKKIEWATKTGSRAVVAIELVTERRVWSDGCEILDTCCEMHIATAIDGKILSYDEPRLLLNVPGFTGVISGKLAVPKQKMDEIKKFIAEIDATPEMVAENDAFRKSIEADEEYYKHCQKMKKAMHE